MQAQPRITQPVGRAAARGGAGRTDKIDRHSDVHSQVLAEVVADARFQAINLAVAVGGAAKLRVRSKALIALSGGLRALCRLCRQECARDDDKENKPQRGSSVAHVAGILAEWSW